MTIPLSLRSLATQEQYQDRFREVLDERAPQFLASVTSQCSSGPLASVNPQSILAAAFVAASLNLPVDRNLGFAWIVPYKDVAQFQMGYRGYIQLALRTGQYERINAFPVNIEALAGFDDVGEPVIDFDLLDDTKEAVGYAIVWKLTNGFRKCVYWSRCRVERHGRRYSRAFRGRSSLWKSNFDDMALKTVIAHGLKRWGILSIEMQQAFRHDQGAQVDIDADIMHPDGAGDLPEIERGRIGGDPAASGLFDDPAGEQVEPEQIPA